MNTAYQYQIKATNSIGAATAYSPTISITTCTIPGTANAPTSTDIEPTYITMTYTALSGATANGVCAGTSITHYSLEYSTNAVSWTVVNTNTAQLLTSITYTLSSGTFVGLSNQYFRMRALNGAGWGPYSATTTVVADSIPGVMTTPTLGAIHPYNATINWTNLTSPTNGGANCTFYLL